jgi:hypothetical protein
MRLKINSKNFDKSFQKLLETKKGENVVKGRFDIEPIGLAQKINFMTRLLLSFKSVSSLTYKVLFWEKDSTVQNFMVPKNGRISEIITSYKNGEMPGVLFVDEEIIDEAFVHTLLINHFNHEIANDPSLNIRVQICVNHEVYVTLLDIYDDRGFDIYYLDSR